MKKKIPFWIAVLATLVSFGTLVIAWLVGAETDWTQTIIITFTLVALIWYTYWTYRISELGAAPVVVGDLQFDPKSGEIYTALRNQSNKTAAVRVFVRVFVYGQAISWDDDYSGKTIWNLTPQFSIRGHFSINKPLSKHGKTFESLLAEANDNNATDQCRISFHMEWEDGEGRKDKSPEHWWHLDLRRNGLIYKVGGFSTQEQGGFSNG